MTTPIHSADLEALAQIYTPVELAILYDWFGLPRPDPLKPVDIRHADDDEDYDGEDETTRAVRLEPSLYGDYNGQSLANAVARLALSHIQHRLPQWAMVSGDGDVFLARKPHRKRAATIELLPQFLLEINWADSGPGFSWPEAYHVTWLPGFDRNLVTASQDSPEMHGYTEQAIGHFAANEDVRLASGAIIVGWWAWQARSWGQQRWAYLFNSGMLDTADALEMAALVWDADSGEPLDHPGKEGESWHRLSG